MINISNELKISLIAPVILILAEFLVLSYGISEKTHEKEFFGWRDTIGKFFYKDFVLLGVISEAIADLNFHI